MSADRFDLAVLGSAPLGISAPCPTMSEGLELAVQAVDQPVVHLSWRG